MGWLVFGDINGLYEPLQIINGNPEDFFIASVIILVAGNAIYRLVKNVYDNLSTAEREIEERERVEKEREALIQKLKLKNQELNRFAIRVSHDLKTPLITVAGFLGFLERDIKEGRHERVEKNVAQISDAAKKMGKFVDELLDLSRVGRITNPPTDAPWGSDMERPIVHPEVEEYLQRVTPPRAPIVAEMEAYAAEHGFPIVGPLVGRLLFVLARTAGARRVFELGSGYGYSTWWFAQAVGAGGEVVHTDGSAENSRRARAYLGRSGLADRVRFEVGDAREIIGREVGPVDVVFCDIDKEGYPGVPALAVPRLRPGGLLIFDNALWYGQVVDPAAPGDDETRGIQELTGVLYSHPELLTTIIPLRDGVSVSARV